MTKEQFIKKAKLVHGENYDYSLVEYKNNKTKVKIKCNNCGKIFEQRPNNHLNGQKCPFCFGSKKLTTEQFANYGEPVKQTLYSLQGVPVGNSYRGPVLKVTLYKNGKKSIRKTFDAPCDQF